MLHILIFYYMKKKFLWLICFLPFQILGQTNEIDHSQISHEDQATILEWYNNTTEMGVEIIGDSIKYSQEFIKVLNDQGYRESLFPNSYSWDRALHYIKHQQLKQAFWYFINLYADSETNKDLVIKSVLAYDQVLKMDEMLISTFYTYGLMDPEISIIKDGKPEIVRPDILEEKLGHVKEMVAYITKYREQQVKEGD
ncbi:hypothetical protein V8G56_12665 [Gaetbulibacter aquiaggeris]|uniref:Uncharacterized protein n=1 Tax=Gaetbulibacter aquiaggeris TaxID=1735373 RepID=A0ABW7MRX8_9FLAO